MISWEPRAEQELKDIYNYIFLDSPQNAKNVISEIVSVADGLSNMPYSNPKEPYFNNDKIRFIVVFNYKIIYLINDIDIVVLSVFNTYQNSFRFRA